jgi:hypothetical protein
VDLRLVISNQRSKPDVDWGDWVVAMAAN